MWQYHPQNRREERGEEKKLYCGNTNANIGEKRVERKLYYGKTIAQIRESKEKKNCIMTLDCAINLFFMLLLLIYRKLNNNM